MINETASDLPEPRVSCSLHEVGYILGRSFAHWHDLRCQVSVKAEIGGVLAKIGISSRSVPSCPNPNTIVASTEQSASTENAVPRICGCRD